MKHFGVTLDTLETLFPFSFIINGKQELIHRGKSLVKACPHLENGETLDKYFSFVRPINVKIVNDITSILNQVCVLESCNSSVKLMGQFIRPSRAPVYVFVGSLVVTDAQELSSLNLNFSDFPVQDQIFDFLLLTQTHKRIIRETDILNKELIKARDTALKASEMKSQFLANMSHELRTPMNGILGMASIIIETTILAPDQKAYVNNIVESAENMLALINDILDLSKIESGYIHLDSEEFDLKELLDEVSLIIAIGVQRKGNTLSYHVESDVSPIIYGDRLRLRQILLNLMGNANKFTSNGKIDVIVKNVEGSDNQLEFTVQDSGIGMNQDVLSRIFSPFVQGDGSMNKKYGGTGLGLSICKKLVEAMSGQIHVTSEEGKGSKFIFTAQLLQNGNDQVKAA